MTRLPQRPAEVPGDLADIFREELSADDLAERTAQRTARRTRRAPRNWPGRLPGWLLFAGGVLLGWFVIGWWLWPVRWTNSDPWEMSGRNQKTFVQLVADRYWTARDLTEAETALGDWDRTEVNSLLVSMQAEIVDTDARQRLEVLLLALRLPGGEQSLLTSILGQEGVVFALVLAVMPMLIAVGLVVLSKMRATDQAENERQLAQDGEADLEELLADVQLDGGGNPDGSNPDDAQLGPPEEEKNPVEEPATPSEEEEEKADPNAPLDLASLFEDEDTSVAALELMCKSLPDVIIEDVIAKGRELLRRFREERREAE